MRLHTNVVSLVYHLFHMNLSILSYSGGKLIIRMIRAHCLKMSLISKHARISKKLGHMLSMYVDTFSVHFDMTVFG